MKKTHILALLMCLVGVAIPAATALSAGAGQVGEEQTWTGSAICTGAPYYLRPSGQVQIKLWSPGYLENTPYGIRYTRDLLDRYTFSTSKRITPIAYSFTPTLLGDYNMQVSVKYNNKYCYRNSVTGYIFDCGNSVLENDMAGAEQCDDGNNIDGDGCSSICQLE